MQIELRLLMKIQSFLSLFLSLSPVSCVLSNKTGLVEWNWVRDLVLHMWEVCVCSLKLEQKYLQILCERVGGGEGIIFSVG